MFESKIFQVLIGRLKYCIANLIQRYEELKPERFLQLGLIQVEPIPFNYFL